MSEAGSSEAKVTLCDTDQLIIDCQNQYTFRARSLWRPGHDYYGMRAKSAPNKRTHATVNPPTEHMRHSISVENCRPITNMLNHL